MRRLLFLGLFVAVPAVAADQCNLVENGSFASGVTHWSADEVREWSSHDVAAQLDSGALALYPAWPFRVFRIGETSQCIPLNYPGAQYLLSAAIKNPSGSDERLARVRVSFPAECDGPEGPGASLSDLRGPSDWKRLQTTISAPSWATHARIFLVVSDSLTETGPSLFDDVSLTPIDVPVPAGTIWQVDPIRPNLRSTVVVTNSTEQIVGTPTPTCVAESVCFAGALPDRPEIAIRIVGPKPNGRLWPTLVRWSTLRLEVWVEDRQSSQLRYYCLPAIQPGNDSLSGLVDRNGITP